MLLHSRCLRRKERVICFQDVVSVPRQTEDSLTPNGSNTPTGAAHRVSASLERLEVRLVTAGRGGCDEACR